MDPSEETTEIQPADPNSSLGTPRILAIGAVALVMIVAAVALAVSFFSSDSQASEIHQITYPTLQGEEASLGAYAGKPLVLNFFASWCGPCVAEMPAFEGVHQETIGRVAFVGLAEEGARPATEIVARTGVTYPTGLDTSGDLLQKFNGLGMPTTVFISPEGEVLDTHIGEMTAEQLRGRLTELYGVQFDG